MMRKVTIWAVALFLSCGMALAQDDPPDGGPPDGVPPEVPPGQEKKDDNGKPEKPGRRAITSRHLLLPPADAENQDANGNFWLKENPVRSAIRVQVKKLEPGVTYDVNITLGEETELLGNVTTISDGMANGGDGADNGDNGGGADGGDDMGGAGAQDGDPNGEVDDDAGNGQLRLDSRRGDELPFGAESVADLVGATVNVSDPDGNVVLTTEVVDLRVHNRGRDGLNKPPADDGNGDNGDGADGGDMAGGGAALPVTEDPAFLVLGLHDASFIRGDSNMDGAINLTDAISTLDYLFRGGPAPYCLDAPDANDDGRLDLSDPIFTLIALFVGPATFPAPADAPGFDSTPDELFCAVR